MKKIIKRIPFFSDLALKIFRIIKPIPKFTSSGDYWEKRYNSGGNSGAGSYNNLADFKGEIINSFIVKKKITNILKQSHPPLSLIILYSFKLYCLSFKLVHLYLCSYFLRMMSVVLPIYMSSSFSKC